MQILNRSPFPAHALVWEARPGQHSLTVCVKGTFELVAGGEASLASGLQLAIDDEDGRPGSPAFPSDLVPFKPKVDVLLIGHVHAPSGGDSEVVATLTLGGLTKSVRARAPAPFASMPLRYELGPAVGENPAAALVSGPPLLEAVTPGEAPSFGPLAWRWPARLLRAPEAAWTWAARVAEGDGDRAGPAPAELDFGCFNAAPAEQQLDLVRAGMALSLENLVPGRPRLETRLPSMKPQAFRFDARTGRATEIVLRCDTVLIDGDRAVVTLVWRGITDVPPPGQFPLGTLVVAADPEGRRLRAADLVELAGGGTASPSTDPLSKRHDVHRGDADPSLLRASGEHPGALGAAPPQPSALGARGASARASAPALGPPAVGELVGGAQMAGTPIIGTQTVGAPIIGTPTVGAPTVGAPTMGGAPPDQPRAPTIAGARLPPPPAPSAPRPPPPPLPAPPAAAAARLPPPPPPPPSVARLPPPPPSAQRIAPPPAPPSAARSTAASAPPIAAGPAQPTPRQQADTEPPPPPPTELADETADELPPAAPLGHVAPSRPERPGLERPEPTASRTDLDALREALRDRGDATGEIRLPDVSRPVVPFGVGAEPHGRAAERGLEHTSDRLPPQLEDLERSTEKIGPIASPPTEPPPFEDWDLDEGSAQETRKVTRPPLPRELGAAAKLARGEELDTKVAGRATTTTLQAPAGAPDEAQAVVDDRSLELTEVAAIAARLAWKGNVRAAVLREVRLSDEHFRGEEKRHQAAIQQETSRGLSKLLRTFDEAYLDEQARLRGSPVTLTEYAELLAAVERGQTARALGALGLAMPDLMRLQRVWNRRGIEDPKLGRELRAAVDKARSE